MITKDMLIGEILSGFDTDIIGEVLTSVGMHCFGCPSSQMESLEEACMVHGLDVNDVVNKLNAALKK